MEFRGLVQSGDGSVGIAGLEQFRRPLDRTFPGVCGRCGMERGNGEQPQEDSDRDGAVSSCECLQLSAPGQVMKITQLYGGHETKSTRGTWDRRRFKKSEAPPVRTHMRPAACYELPIDWKYLVTPNV